MMKKFSKKGFTLIETLAVIIILAVLTLILVPAINNIIASARKAAFKSSVYGLLSTTNAYIGDNVLSNFGDISPTVFTCDGVSCTDGTYSLQFSGTIPIGGTVTVNSENDVYATMITNGVWCASGHKEDLVVADNCALLDKTAPVINSDFTLQSTSNSVLVTIPTDYASDDESDISSYRIAIYLDNNKVDEVTKTNTKQNITAKFTNLKNKTLYKVVVTAINGNKLETDNDKEVTTSDITNPVISYNNNPSDAVNGYLLSEDVNVNFTNTNIDNPTYYIKSTRLGTSNIQITSSCGTDTMPGTCSDIAALTSLSVSTWYKVSGNITITYNQNTSSNDTIYALTYDGVNYSGSVTGTIAKIDTTVPTISATVSGKVATLTMNDNGSGVSYFCVNNTNSISGCTWTTIANQNSTTASYTASAAGTYYAFAKDGLGNVSGVSATLTFAKAAFCSYAPGQTWTYGYSGSISSFTATCSGVYKLEVWGAQGGTSNGGYGGYSIGYSNLSANTVLYLAVGSQTTGYNGGRQTYYAGSRYNGGGGGATSITTTNRGELKNFSSYHSEVLIVAGGGGGGNTGNKTSSGGTGGGLNGGDGSSMANCCYYGSDAFQNNAYGGTQDNGGYTGVGHTTDMSTYASNSGGFGQGGYLSGTGWDAYETGGGSGWYGGGGGGLTTNYTQGGGGGSGYIGGVPSFSYNGTTYSPGTTNGVQAGDGKITITYMDY